MHDMRPFIVQALLTRPLVCHHPVALDALLAAVEAVGRSLPPLSLVHEPEQVHVPLLWNDRGFHHASSAHLVVAEYEVRHWARRGPDVLAVARITSASRLPTAGRYKAFFVPLRLVMPAGMTLTWWGVGDISAVAELLSHVFGIGQKRGSGHGWVARWTVREIEEDISLLGPDGEPRRNLPVDMAPPGWTHLSIERLTYPYWRREGAALVAVPAPSELDHASR